MFVDCNLLCRLACETESFKLWTFFVCVCVVCVKEPTGQRKRVAFWWIKHNQQMYWVHLNEVIITAACRSCQILSFQFNIQPAAFYYRRRRRLFSKHQSSVLISIAHSSPALPSALPFYKKKKIRTVDDRDNRWGIGDDTYSLTERNRGHRAHQALTAVIWPVDLL